MFKSQHSSFKGLHKGTQHNLYLYKGCCAFYFSWLFVTMVTIIKHFRKPDFFRVCKTLSSDTLIDLASCKICKNHCEYYKKHTSRLWPVLFSATYMFFFFSLHTLSSPVLKWNVIVITALLSNLDHRLLFKYTYNNRLF